MIPRLILRLLRLFAIGCISARNVQDLAGAAWADGWATDSEIARRIAEAGSAGRNPQHIAKGIIQAAKAGGLLTSLSKPYIVKVPGQEA